MKQLIPKTLSDILLVAVLIGVPSVTLVSSLFIYDFSKPDGTLAVATSTAQTNPFDEVTVSAKAAIVYDMTTGEVLYAKNATKPLPLASITKIMTSLVALQEASGNTELAVNDEALAEEGDSGLLRGERWNLLDLIEFTLVSSSNDGARAVASAVQAVRPGKSFVTRMNEEARELGLTSMRFENPTGLDVNQSEAGAYGSAQDVAKLFSFAMTNHPEIFEATKNDKVSISSDMGSHYAENTNVVADAIPGLIGSKTGYSDLAGGNLAVIINVGIDRPVVIVALASSYDGRFNDIIKLAGTTFAYTAYSSLEK